MSQLSIKWMVFGFMVFAAVYAGLTAWIMTTQIPPLNEWSHTSTSSLSIRIALILMDIVSFICTFAMSISVYRHKVVEPSDLIRPIN
ncbi:MAG: hypothetical protein WCK01_00880 [Candidatus Uhrbacteria bacterium]